MLSGAQHQLSRTSASRCPSVHCHASGQTQQPTNSGKPLTRIPSREARKPAQAPAPVPVQHSSTYLVRGDEPPPEATSSRPAQPVEEEPFSGNALQWSLRKLDARLSEKEKNPTASDQAAWRLGSGPVGVTAAKGVSKAAQLSITAGQKAIKAAVPLGQQALGQGAGLAWRMLQGSKQRRRERED